MKTNLIILKILKLIHIFPHRKFSMFCGVLFICIYTNKKIREPLGIDCKNMLAVVSSPESAIFSKVVKPFFISTLKVVSK